MRKLTIALILIIGTNIPMLVFGQNTDLSEIITTAFNYEPLESFLEMKDEKIALETLFTNNLIPKTTMIYAFDQKIKVMSGKEVEPGTILLRKVSIKPERAKIKFSYHNTVRAKMGLVYEEGAWKVKSSFIKLKAEDENGEKRSRMHWNF